MSVSVTLLVKGFSDFLKSSWVFVQESFQGEDGQDAKDDWLQANWELLVERGLGVRVFLEPYGNGADCYGKSARVTFNTELPTHSIICKSKSDRPLLDLLTKKELKEETLVFERLVTMTDDGWYADITPFDKVLCLADDDEVIFNFDELEFSLSESKNLM